MVKNLVLIGYRGTGKSSVAEGIAMRLSWSKVSTDELICARTGRSIPEIVAAQGWEGFRDIESAVVHEVACRERQVIDTGGGVVLRKENMDALRLKGVFVWLKASVETIGKRIGGDPGRPPLIAGKGIVDEIAEVLRKRTPLYESAADYNVDTDNMTIDAICDLLMGWLKGRGFI